MNLRFLHSKSRPRPKPIAPALAAILSQRSETNVPANSQIRIDVASVLWITALSLGLIILFGAVQIAAPGLVGNDGYYHLKMAVLQKTTLLKGGLAPTFTWLPLTILKADAYYDHHWLFHVLLTPFVSANLLAGGKIATVIFATSALAMAGWLLRSHDVKSAGLWTILIFAASTGFVYRLSMLRAQSLSLLWLLAAIYCLLRRRECWLVVVGLTYVWLYDAFPLLLLVAGLYFVLARLLEGEWRWGALVYSSLGLGLGLIVNPYFPQALTFIYHHLIAKLDPTSLPVGNEWYPYTTTLLLSNAGLAIVAFLIGCLALGLTRQRLTLPTALFFGLSVLFGAMLMQSRRFVEYFPAFAILFCAFACQPLWTNLPFRKGAAVLFALTVVVATGLTLRTTRATLADEPDPTLFAGAANWLATHTPQGSLVFQTDWDDFTRLFFYNTHNTYTIGLDPTYLERADPVRYYLWIDLTQGRGLDLSQDIRQQFGAEYVVSDLKHTAFLNRAASDPQMEEVYRDENSIVYHVHGQ